MTSDISTEDRAVDTPKTKRKPVWNRTVINFWLDCFLLVNFLTVAAAAAVLQFVFPLPTLATGWSVWGYSYNDWRAFEFGALCLLASGILIHVMLHWSWICGVVARRFFGRRGEADDGIRTLYGVALMIILLHIVGSVVAAAWLTVQAPH